MLISPEQANALGRANVVLLSAFLALVFVCGGASRADVMSLPIVRIASVLVIAVALAQLGRDQWRMVRIPAIFLLALGAIIAAQLVPLPPGLWAALPGHDRYVDALKLAGVAPVWRPISLTPDLTLNSLLAVLPPLAVVIGIAIVDRAFLKRLLPLLLIAIAASVLLGLFQIASGAPYFYSITNDGQAVGFFANRNHLAVFVALGIPLVATWAALPHPDAGYRRLRTWLALLASVALFPLLIVIGSRAGLLIGAIGALAAFGLARTSMGHERDPAKRAPWPGLIALAPLLLGAIAALGMMLFGRDQALQRLLDSGPNELRSELLPTFWTMISDFLPLGAGFGAFDPVFRSYEPQQFLTLSYLNHAHNDLAQIVFEGGLPALLLVLAFFAWLIRRAWSLWTRKISSPADQYGRCGTVLVALMLAASLVDYPLRTPLMAVTFAIACCWILPSQRTPASEAPSQGRVGSAPSLE